MGSDDLLRILLVVIVIALLVPILVMFAAWPMMGAWGGGHMWNGGMWDASGVAWLWLLPWLVFLVLVLGGGYLFYRAFRRGKSDPAIEALRVSYARGELSEEEFEARLKRLRRGDR